MDTLLQYVQENYYHEYLTLLIREQDVERDLESFRAEMDNELEAPEGEWDLHEIWTVSDADIDEEREHLDRDNAERIEMIRNARRIVNALIAENGDRSNTRQGILSRAEIEALILLKRCAQ